MTSDQLSYTNNTTKCALTSFGYVVVVDWSNRGVCIPSWFSRITHNTSVGVRVLGPDLGAEPKVQTLGLQKSDIGP